MGWKSLFFGDSSAAVAKRTIRESTAAVTEVIGPISALSVEMVAASWKCCKALKPAFRPHPGMRQHPEYQDAYVFFTLLSYSMFWFGILAFKAGWLDRSERYELKETLLEILTTSQVETFFGADPDKAKVHAMLRESLNAGDSRYAKGDDCFARLRDDVFQFMHRDGSDFEAVSAFETAIAQVFLGGILNPDRIGALIQNARAAVKASKV